MRFGQSGGSTRSDFKFWINRSPFLHNVQCVVMPLTKSELKYLRSLSQKKMREQEGKFLLEGWRPLQEALAANAKIESVVIEKTAIDRADYQEIVVGLRKRSITLKLATARELESLSSTVHSQGVLAVVEKKTESIDAVFSQKPQFMVAADAVSDPGNLGSIVRSCDWFGVEALLLGKGCVELYNEKVLRSTAGSIFHLPIIEHVDLLNVLDQAKREGYGVFTLSSDGSKSYLNGTMNPPCVLVVGNEAHGVRAAVRSISDEVVQIPRYGAAESLNVGVACGVVLAHLRSIYPLSQRTHR